MNKRAIGTQYEYLAREYLIENGYTIIDKNYRCKLGEIDIIAMDNDYLCFIEVKYRLNSNKGHPAESITANKMLRITKTAQYYMMSNKYSTNIKCRFDVVAILADKIELIKNAFDAHY
ncbi:MAG TPA: YraN family protein [Clostridiales bacterium]|nr:YraN family protein [Clostridiales bacterium]